MKQNLSEWGSFYWVIPVVVISLLIVFLFDRSKFKKPGLALLLILWSSAVLYLMFLYRLPAGKGKIITTPFHMYREAQRYSGSIATNQSLRQILFNMLLFVPLGAILTSLTHRPWLAVAVGILISVIAELLQYWSGLGWADIDDVISNTLGLLLGVLIFLLYRVIATRMYRE